MPTQSGFIAQKVILRKCFKEKLGEQEKFTSGLLNLNNKTQNY